MTIDPFLCRECHDGRDISDAEASTLLDTGSKVGKEITDYDSEGDVSEESSYKPSEKPKAKREKDIIKKKYKDSKDTVSKKHKDSKGDSELSIGTGGGLKGKRILKAPRKSAEKPKDFDYTKERDIDNNN